MPVDLMRETIHSTSITTMPDGLLNKKIETHMCSGFELTATGESIPRTYKRTVITTTGSKSIMKRRKWAHFGPVKSPPQVLGDDVYLKLQSNERERINDTGFYLGLARESKFTPIEMTAIRTSDDAQGTFLKILNEVYYKISSKKDVTAPVVKKPDATGIGLMLRNDRQKKKSNEHLLTVLLDNVPTWYTVEDVRDYLGDLRVERINIVKPRIDSKLESGGKVFLVLSTEEEAKYAISNLNGSKWDHHVISAQVSKPRVPVVA